MKKRILLAVTAGVLFAGQAARGTNGNAFMDAVREGKKGVSLRTIKALVEKGFDVNAELKNVKLRIFKVEKISELKKEYKEQREKTIEQMKAIGYESLVGKPKPIMEHEVKEARDMTPLHFVIGHAFEEGVTLGQVRATYVPIIKYLLANGANIKAKDSRHRTPITYLHFDVISKIDQIDVTSESRLKSVNMLMTLSPYIEENDL